MRTVGGTVPQIPVVQGLLLRQTHDRVVLAGSVDRRPKLKLMQGWGAFNGNTKIPVLLCACFCWIGCVFWGNAFAQNLVTNGSFPVATDPPAGWVKEKDVAGKGTVRVTNGLLELLPNKANTPSSKPLGVGQAINASALAGRTLVISAAIGLRGPAESAVVGIHALRSNGSEIANLQLRRIQVGDQLEIKTGTLTLPKEEKPSRLILYAVTEGTGGAAQFRDISVVSTDPNPVATAPTTTGQNRPLQVGLEPAYAAQVSVDASLQLRTIPRGLYGVNVEWWRNANGIWDASQDKLDATALKLSKDLRPALIRFPGGFLGDIYDWNSGVGPRKSRPPMLADHKGSNKEIPSFGTDELFQFASAIDADLVLQTNMGTGTAKMAASWVQYVKSLLQKNPVGPRVQWWEMGNELYHKGDASGGSLPPEKYVAKFREFAQEMRSADPSIRLGAIGMENYATFPFNSYPDWNEIVLKRLGGEIDFFALHNAYAPVAPDDKLKPQEVYKSLWAAPVMVEENLRTVSDQIRKFAPPGRADRIKISVTEWAPLFHVTTASKWIDHSKTLGSALYVADILRVFVQNDRVDSAMFFKLNEPSFLGLLGVRSGAWIPNASFHAFQLFSRYFGTTLVGSTAKSPTYDSLRAGLIPKTAGVPLLTTVASLSADRNRLYVMLINKSVDQTANVALALGGFDPIAGTAHLLTGASPDSNTGAELPKVPGLAWARQVNIDEKLRHFDHGAPTEISFTSTALTTVGKTFAYRVPPHSVVSLELQSKR